MSGQSAPDAARRALVLCAVAARAYLEEGAGDAHAESIRTQLTSFVATVGLSLEDAEKALLACPLGLLSRRAQEEASWRSEGAAVLSWALGRTALPPLDEDVEPKRIADALGFLKPEAIALVRDAQLKPAEELHLLSARQAWVEARLRAFLGNRKPVDLARLAAGSPLGTLVLEGLPLVEGDLGIKGQPLARAADEDVGRALAIAQERLRAAQWLTGERAAFNDA